MEVAIAKRPFWAHTLGRGLLIPIITCWEVFKPYNNLLGGFYRLHWRACAETIAVHVKLSSLWEKKSDTEIKSWPRWNSNRVQLHPKSQIFQLSHEALDEFSWLISLSYDGSGQAQVSSGANTSYCTCKWSALRAHFLPPWNGGRDRALLQNDRRKFLNYFPFSSSPKIIVSPE